MPSFIHTVAISALLLAQTFVAVTVSAQGKPPPEVTANTDGPVLLAPFKRADERATLVMKNGKSRELHVAVNQWTLVAGREITRFPEQGDVIVQLQAGLVTTVIGGHKQERKEGDFWLVPAGSAMSVTVTTEMATMQTVAVRK